MLFVHHVTTDLGWSFLLKLYPIGWYCRGSLCYGFRYPIVMLSNHVANRFNNCSGTMFPPWRSSWSSGTILYLMKTFVVETLYDVLQFLHLFATWLLIITTGYPIGYITYICMMNIRDVLRDCSSSGIHEYSSSTGAHLLACVVVHL